MSQSESPRNLTCYLWNKGQPVHKASDVSCFQWWVAEGTADLGSPSPRIYCHVSPAYCRWNSTDRFHVCSKQAGSKSLTFLMSPIPCVVHLKLDCSEEDRWGRKLVTTAHAPLPNLHSYIKAEQTGCWKDKEPQQIHYWGYWQTVPQILH